MGYGVSYFMRKDYLGWNTLEGQTRFLNELKDTLMKLGLTGMEPLMEASESCHEMYLNDGLAYATEFLVYGNMIEAYTALGWTTFLQEDVAMPIRRELRRIAEAIGAQDCCIGTDYTTGQADFPWPDDFEGWIAAAEKRFGKIEEFDLKRLADDLGNGKWPSDLYHDSIRDIG
mgnify:CR=1 FL=1